MASISCLYNGQHFFPSVYDGKLRNTVFPELFPTIEVTKKVLAIGESSSCSYNGQHFVRDPYDQMSDELWVAGSVSAPIFCAYVPAVRQFRFLGILVPLPI